MYAMTYRAGALPTEAPPVGRPLINRAIRTSVGAVTSVKITTLEESMEKKKGTFAKARSAALCLMWVKIPSPILCLPYSR